MLVTRGLGGKFPSAAASGFGSYLPNVVPVPDSDGGGGDGLRRRPRRDEMSVEEWRLWKRQLAEDDQTVTRMFEALVRIL